MAFVYYSIRSVSPNTWTTVHTVPTGKEFVVLDTMIHNWGFKSARCLFGVMNDSLTELPAPLNLNVTPQGTPGTTSYSYVVTAINSNGETSTSALGTTTTGAATLSSTNLNRLIWDPVQGATQYAIYKHNNNVFYFLATSNYTIFDDTGANSITMDIRAPFINTTKLSAILAYEELDAKFSAGDSSKKTFPAGTKLVFAADSPYVNFVLFGDES